MNDLPDEFKVCRSKGSPVFNYSSFTSDGPTDMCKAILPFIINTEQLFQTINKFTYC